MRYVNHSRCPSHSFWVAHGWDIRLLYFYGSAFRRTLHCTLSCISCWSWSGCTSELACSSALLSSCFDSSWTSIDSWTDVGSPSPQIFYCLIIKSLLFVDDRPGNLHSLSLRTIVLVISGVTIELASAHQSHLCSLGWLGGRVLNRAVFSVIWSLQKCRAFFFFKNCLLTHIVI